MNKFLILNFDALWYLFGAGLLVFLYWWCFWRKGIALKRLASLELLGKINSDVSLSRQIFKAFVVVLAFVFIVVGLTRPTWNAEPKKFARKGRDVVILLDVSRSMLAEDIKPNRLERARIAISDLLEILDGDRVALVTFAGSSTVKCPLTQDYAFMRLALGEISTESTNLGGTMIGDAIRKAVDEVFGSGGKEFKDIILITDGEDHESFPEEAAAKAGSEGIRIIAIGLGSEDEGTPIPVIDDKGRKTLLKYKGEIVRSKLDASTLRQVAINSAGGTYLPVRTRTFDLDTIYEDLVMSAQERELEETTMMEYDEKFQVFLGVGILLLVFEMLLRERKKIYPRISRINTD
ncbi:MAG: VWA domain-containing protein [Planctomycetes bacterium]|nr:VWA domain-containing protein [Planctomycetota bacterium]